MYFPEWCDICLDSALKGDKDKAVTEDDKLGFSGYEKEALMNAEVFKTG